MGITGIGGYQQPFTTPLSSGPTAAQQTQPKDPNQEAQAAEQERQQTQVQKSGGNTTPTRGQNLNITA